MRTVMQMLKYAAADNASVVEVLDSLLKNLDTALGALRGVKADYSKLKSLYPKIENSVDGKALAGSFNVFQTLFTNLTEWKLKIRNQK